MFRGPVIPGTRPNSTRVPRTDCAEIRNPTLRGAITPCLRSGPVPARNLSSARRHQHHWRQGGPSSRVGIYSDRPAAKSPIDPNSRSKTADGELRGPFLHARSRSQRTTNAQAEVLPGLERYRGLLPSSQRPRRSNIDSPVRDASLSRPRARSEAAV
jgi:hypothetical protein